MFKYAVALVAALAAIGAEAHPRHAHQAFHFGRDLAHNHTSVLPSTGQPTVSRRKSS